MTERAEGESTRLIGMREFRERFQELREPVKVVRSRGGMEVIGTFYPARRQAADKR